MIQTKISRMPNTSVTAFLAVVLLVVAAGSTFGQGVDKGCSGTVANPCGGSGGSSGGSSGGGGSIWSRPARDPAEDARQKRLNEAHVANERGVAFYKNGDYASAVKAFQEAVDKNPDSENLKKNLAHAKEELQFQLDREVEDARQARLSADAAKKMTASMQNLADSLTATPASSGLEFGDMKDLKDAVGPSSSLNYVMGANDPCKPATGSLTFGDPKTVDARCVPSGLTKFIDDSIEKDFAKSPEGVGERVRKGFEALMMQDRKAAKAWFEDALNRDPNNEGLKRVIDLIDDTSKYQSRPKIIKAAPKQSVDPLDMEFLAFVFGPKQPENLQVPQPEDIAFLFIGKNEIPTIYVDFKDGTFFTHTPSVGGTVFLAEGPYTVLPNGGLKPSTDPENLEAWAKYFKENPSQLVPPQNSIEIHPSYLPPADTKRP